MLLSSISVEPMSKKQIWYIAKEVRKLLGVEDELYFDIVPIIEYLVHKEVLNMEIVDINEMPYDYGRTIPGDNVIRVREDVYRRAAEGNPRDRFTMCHEFGHFLLHTIDRVSFSRGNVPAYMDPEWQANEFAAEIMAPVDMIEGLSINEIASRCGMSYQAAEKQFYKHI